MSNIFAIIGERNTRKSATTRALTGAFKRGVYQIETSGGDIIDFFVQISSLQESGISPKEFIEECNQNSYSDVLVCLWISGGNGQPNGLTYIQNFLNAGWDIREIVVLGTNKLPYTLPQHTPTPNFVSNSQNLPANNIASRIREWWQWL
jgi:hypothetical protein